jgi:flagellar biosynthetic protein FliR
VIDFGPIAHFGLLLVRPGMLVMAAPVFGGTYAPTPTRAGLVVLLALVLTPLVAVPDIASTVGLSIVIAREMAIGFAIALAIRALVAGAELGGQLSGMQLMLSYGSVIDPQGGVKNNLIGSIYGNLTVLTFLAINGHHAVIRSLVSSYAAMPIGPGHVDPSLVRSVMQMLGVVFVLGVRLAAPLIVVLLIVELATGLVSRAAPALNLMAVGTPIRLVVGLLVVAALVPLIPGVINRFTSIVVELGLQTAGAFR